MTGHGVLPGLWPIQGDGVLARQGDLVLLIHPAGGPFTDRLLGLLADSARAGQDGLRFTELVSAEFDADAAAAGDRPGPAVVAFGPVGGGTAVAVYGTGWAEVTTAYGAQRLTTGEPYGRLRSVLPSPLTMVSAGVQPVSPGSETDPYLRLADGVVRAVALVYAPAGIQSDADGGGRPAVTDHDGVPGAVAGLAVSGQQAAGPAAQEAVREEIPQATPVPPPEPEPEPEAVQPAESEYWATQIEPVASAPYAPEVHQPAPDPYAPEVPQDPFAAEVPLAPGEPGGEAPDHAPVPLGAEPPGDLGPGDVPSEMVEGVYCKNGHFNDPEARSCAVCDISIGPLAKVRQQGPRPPLGVLLLGDGSVCQLDADYVIGREPTLDSAVAEGRARPLRVNDTSGVVSRIHARVELDGWQVFITDLKSANGTEVLLPGERNPTSLLPGVRLPLMAGTQIRLGGEYGLQYDSHRQQ
jgi:FHA domain